MRLKLAKAKVNSKFRTAAAKAANAVGIALSKLGATHLEPPFTFCREGCTNTLDYIFYSAETLKVTSLMTIPARESLVGSDPRFEPTIDKEGEERPANWDDRRLVQKFSDETNMLEWVPNPAFKGVWRPTQLPNPLSVHNYAPSEQWASDHFALLSEFHFQDNNLAAEWANHTEDPHPSSGGGAAQGGKAGGSKAGGSKAGGKGGNARRKA